MLQADYFMSMRCVHSLRERWSRSKFTGIILIPFFVFDSPIFQMLISILERTSTIDAHDRSRFEEYYPNLNSEDFFDLPNDSYGVEDFWSPLFLVAGKL